MKMGVFMLAAFLPVACEAARTRTGVQFLAKQLSEGAGTPDTIAEKLVTIENDWDAQVRLSVKCEAKSHRECPSPPLFQQSCSAVAASFAQRGGDRVGVHSFMTAVCSAPALNVPSRGQCQILATALEDQMATGKAVDSIDTNSLCQQFWTQLLQNARAEERREEDADATAAAAAAAAATPAKTANTANTAAATPPDSRQEQINGTSPRQLNVFQKALGAGQGKVAAQSDASAVSDAKDGESSNEGDDTEEDGGEDQSDQATAASDTTDDADDQADDDNDA